MTWLFGNNCGWQESRNRLFMPGFRWFENHQKWELSCLKAKTLIYINQSSSVVLGNNCGWPSYFSNYCGWQESRDKIINARLQITWEWNEKRDFSCLQAKGLTYIDCYPLFLLEENCGWQTVICK